MGFTGEGKLGGLNVEFHVIFGYIWYAEGKVDDILGGIRWAGALCPEDLKLSVWFK